MTCNDNFHQVLFILALEWNFQSFIKLQPTIDLAQEFPHGRNEWQTLEMREDMVGFLDNKNYQGVGRPFTYN
jgi:hypothetical protein